MSISTTPETPRDRTAEEIDAAAVAKNDREVKKTDEKQKQSEAEKGPHDGKYFVVKGGTCVCDKAEDPTKTAKIVVTSHTKHIINDGKLAVTEADTTMDPPAVTYGKCTLKPSSGGNLPCAPAFAPKWEKPYDNKKTQGKKHVTEISTLQCMVGGKVTIKTHGQKNSVSNEHSENSNDAEQMLINPAVYKPKLAPAYPIIENITLKTISDRPDHKPVASDADKKVEKIILRKDEEGSFVAKIKKGNVDLTSWAMYDDKGAKIQGVERKGTAFECKFLAVGNYKIEAYGIPITPEANDSKAEKKADKNALKENEEKHTLEVEVIVNKLKGKTLQTIDGDTFTRDQELNNKIGKVKVKVIEHRLRKDFPATFKATFVLAPNAQEIERIRMYVTDGLGNVLQDMGSQTGNSFMFIPHNTGAKYRVIAEYTHEDNVIDQQVFEAVTESLSVVSITNPAQVVRPETPMTFTAQTNYKTAGNLTGAENEIIKWNLNGAFVGTGSTITLQGGHFIAEGNYVVEGYVTTANATITMTGKTKESSNKDDWHFEVKKNDVDKFNYIGMPKVGKKTQLTAQYIMTPIDGEKTVWTIFGQTVIGQTIDITPATAGIAHVACKINYMPGKKQTIEIKQAVVNDVMFTDSGGIEIKKASWGQKVNVWINHKNLEDEDFIFTVIHENMTVHVQTIKAFNQYLIPLSIDEFMHKKVGKIGKLQIKITTPNLKVIGDGVAFPKVPFDVQDTPEVYEAHIGSEDGKDKHTMVDYDKVSWFYAKSRGIKPNESLRLEIRQSFLGFSFSPDLDKLLLDADNVRPDDSGMIKIKLQWSEVKPKVAIRNVYAIIKDSKGTILYSTGYVFGNIVSLVQTSTVVKLAEYKSAVMVKGDPVNKESGICVCKDYDLIWGNKVSCEFRKKVVEICKDLWPNDKMEMANNLMAVMAWESGESFSPSIKNPNSSATGLIQFMKSTAEDLGTTTAKLAKMTAVEQLDYVKKYFKSQKGKKLEFVDFYLQVLFPASMFKPDNHVVFSKDGTGLDENDRNYKARINAYSVNSGFDTNLNYGNNDGMVTVAEIKKGIQNYIDKGKLNRSLVNPKCSINTKKDDTKKNTVNLHFDGETSDEGSLSQKTKDILKEVGDASKNYDIYITSTARSTYDQAKIMYENCSKTGGVERQKGIYANSGDQVVDVYSNEKNLGKTKEEIIASMDSKIKELGPSNVSKHIADFSVMNTFDISYSKLTNKNDFLSEIKKRSELDKVLVENNCYHVQINQ